MRYWKVGELARATGLTVRALHHYDAIGLLTPSHRTAAGYRQYGEHDLTRLQRILSLRQLGLSLEEVRECLARPELSLERVLRLHIERLRKRIREQCRLCERLEATAVRLEGAEGVSADEILDIIRRTTMIERHFTPEQLERLEERRLALGDEHIRAVEEEWPRLIAAMRAKLDAGVAPEDEEVQRLAARWAELVAEFSGGDPGLERSVARMYRGEPEAARRYRLDARLFEFVGRARAGARASEG